MKLSIRNFLLSLTLLVPALQQTACADEVTYLYRSWDESTKVGQTYSPILIIVRTRAR